MVVIDGGAALDQAERLPSAKAHDGDEIDTRHEALELAPNVAIEDVMRIAPKLLSDLSNCAVHARVRTQGLAR
jgi:hypothetical protein